MEKPWENHARLLRQKKSNSMGHGFHGKKITGGIWRLVHLDVRLVHCEFRATQPGDALTQDVCHTAVNALHRFFCRISWLEAPNNTSTFVCCTLTQRDICHVQLPSKTSMVSCNGYANNRQVSWTSFNSLPIVCGMVELYLSNS